MSRESELDKIIVPRKLMISLIECLLSGPETDRGVIIELAAVLAHK